METNEVNPVPISRETVENLSAGLDFSGTFDSGAWHKSFGTRQPKLERFVGCLTLTVWQPRAKEPTKIKWSVTCGRSEEHFGGANTWEAAMGLAEDAARAVANEILEGLTKQEKTP